MFDEDINKAVESITESVKGGISQCSEHNKFSPHRVYFSTEGKNALSKSLETFSELIVKRIGKLLGDGKIEAALEKEAEENRLAVVCYSCNKASCWQGFSTCKKYGLIDTYSIKVTYKELRILNLESPEFFIPITWHKETKEWKR